MTPRRPPLPRAEPGLARFVRSEAELDAMLAFVERTSLPPEMPVDPRVFAPPSFEDRSERLDLDGVLARLSSAPAPAGMLHTRRATDPGRAGRRVDMDAVLERLSMNPSPNLRPSTRPTVDASTRMPSWPRLAMVATVSFVLGAALTYLTA